MITTAQQMKDNPIKYLAKDLHKHFPDMIYKCKWTYEKMFNISSQERAEHQKNRKYLFTPTMMALL